MATFSDGHNGSHATERSDSASAITNASGPGTLRIQLQALLDDKERQLKLAGTLGQRVLAQQVELEERISQLNDLEAVKPNASDEEVVELDIREKLRELRDTMNVWETENQEIFDFLGNKANDVPPTPISSLHPLGGDEITSVSPASGPSAAQSSRRAKNAAHRAHDVEFAFEIGSSLLTEVRRLQSLIGERDKAIQDLNEENQDLRQAVEDLKSGLETQKSTAEKYKEENWNLEVSQQELRTQLHNVQKELESSEMERKRTARELLRAKDSIDQHKTEAERLTTALAEFKAKHETDIAQMRKHAAGLQRDKSDLQSALEALKSDMAKKERSIKRFGSPLTPNGLSPYTPAPGADGEDEEDVFGGTGGASNRRKHDNSIGGLNENLASDLVDSSPDPSPSRPHLGLNHPNNEIEVLRQSLAHSQRQVNMLRGTVQREKELRMEYRRKLAEAEGKIMVEAEIDDEEEENIDPKRPRPPRISRGRGRGRGITHRTKGGRPLGQRPPSTPDIIEMDSDEEDVDPASDTVLDLKQVVAVDELEKLEDVNEIPYGHERHVSADGLDPAFANVLRPTPPSPTPTHGSSPVKEPVPRGGRRTRGGAPRSVEPRPPSVVEPAGALAAELGMSDEVLNPELILSQHVDTAEVSCQTDPEPTPEPVIITVAPPETEKSEIGIQAEIVIETVEVGLQTAPEVADVGTSPDVPIAIEIEIQTIPEPERVDVDVQTLPPPEPSVEVPVKSTSPTFSANAGVAITRRGTIIGPPSLRAIETEDDGPETDAGTETEGEYTDAPEYPASGSDFYSARTGTQSVIDNASMRPQESAEDFYSVPESDADDSDQESIKASTLSRARTISRMTAGSIGLGYATYDTRTPKASLHPPPVLKSFSDESIQVDVPSVEVKETSIQTDEWTPPATVPVFHQSPPPASPPPPSSPSPTPSFTLLRVGPHSQQFQYISPPSGSPSPSPNTSVANASKDSAATIIAAPRRTSSLVSKETDRRPSIEAALANDEVSRARTQSTQSTQSLLPPPTLFSPPDKTRPPTMMLPPPPKMPPPPEKKISTGSSRDMLPPPRDPQPPRPTSPPPAELIQRATTPIFGNQGLLVPSRSGIRQHGASMPPLQSALGNRPSTNSFRSAVNAASFANASGQSGTSVVDATSTKKQQSTTSLVSSRHSSLSRRSSLSSDKHEAHVPGIPNLPKPSSFLPPNRPSQQSNEGSTDPTIIHAITQTMIGEFLYKYTRKVVGKGHGDRRHKRFFWVHPYTKTLYWSSADPGSSNVGESSAKSAYIESVRSVLDPNPLPPGICQYSVVVSTPQREMKFTAPTKERHDIWFNALNYLLGRPGGNGPGGLPADQGSNGPIPPPAPAPMYGSMRLPRDEHPRKEVLASPRSAKSFGSAVSGDSWNITPRAQRSQSRLSASGSVGKRSDTPAAEYLRLAGPEGIGSPSKLDYEYIPGRAEDEELDFEIHDDSRNNEAFEGLENVRACCDGRHDLGTLTNSRKHHHHHHHYHHHHHQGQHVEGEEPTSRPVSPAWSFRSRAGSTASRGADAASIWSRFGTRRSKAAPPIPTSP